MQPIETYNEINGKKLVEALAKRNMEGYYCATKEEALKKALELIPEGASVTWGGSQSIQQIGLTAALKNGAYNVYDRADAKDADEVQEIYRKAFSVDYYLASSNAITYDGQLLNIDGNGNRVAAMIFGPKNVLLIVGMNKLTKDIDSAMDRVRNYASVLNVLRLDCDTPCKTVGKCSDCISPQTVCCQVVTTRFSRTKNRIKIILVGEELGY